MVLGVMPHSQFCVDALCVTGAGDPWQAAASRADHSVLEGFIFCLDLLSHCSFKGMCMLCL